jgi:hypothetical protein
VYHSHNDPESNKRSCFITFLLLLLVTLQHKTKKNLESEILVLSESVMQELSTNILVFDIITCQWQMVIQTEHDAHPFTSLIHSLPSYPMLYSTCNM